MSPHHRFRGTVLRCLLIACRTLSFPIAAIHATAYRAGITHLPAWVSRAPLGLNGTLQEIWFGRLARELLSVVAICHSPWVRLLATCCRQRNFALVPAAPRWEKHTGLAHVPRDPAGFRRVLRHLGQGGRIIVVVDVFSGEGGVPIRLLGRDGEASPLAARVAGITGVPVVAVVPVFRENRLHMEVGAVFHTGPSDGEPGQVTKRLMAFFEREIRRQPAVWSDILRVE